MLYAGDADKTYAPESPMCPYAATSYILTRMAPPLFQVHAHSYFAIFQQSQPDNVLESKIVPPRMAPSTSASERTTG